MMINFLKKINQLRINNIIQFGLRLASIITIILSIYLILQKDFWIDILGGISPITTCSISVIFVAADYSFYSKGVDKYTSIIYSIFLCNVFLQSYELIYHFTFPVHLNYFIFPFLNGQEIKYLLIEFIMILPIYFIYKHLSIKKVSFILLGLFISIWIIWILFGYPQYFIGNMEYWEFFYPNIFITNDPWSVSLTLNFGSKIIFAIFFISLLNLHPLKLNLEQ
jgi:hypothetical protein